VAESGCCDDPGSVNLTAYDPTAHTWRTLPPTPLTVQFHGARFGAAGAWTGTEMIVTGGFSSTDGTAGHVVAATDGAAWNAATNTWHAIAPMPAPLPGQDPTAVWTGHEMLVWSSAPTDPIDGTHAGEVALAYNPTTNTWRTLPPSGLAPRTGAIAVWTGKELVVWGGLTSSPGDTPTPPNAYGDGARLDPNTGTWQRLPPAPVPARGDATAVWSGHEVLLWGGETGSGTEVGKGAAYNPRTNQWRALPASPLRAKTLTASVWTGDDFVIIGGSTPSYQFPMPGPGTAAYDPTTNTWTALPNAPLDPNPGSDHPPPAADQRLDGLTGWTGKSIVLVGGWDGTQQANRSDGIEWTPAR
jgi:hypothetical protein